MREEKGVTAGPKWVPLSSPVGGRDAVFKITTGSENTIFGGCSIFLTLSLENRSTEGRGQNKAKYKLSEDGLSSATVERRGRPMLGGEREGFGYHIRPIPYDTLNPSK
jgi:hypothetical protein